MAKHGAHRTRPAKVRMTPARKAKVHKVMAEHKRGTLRSGSGAPVTGRKQAVAIALSQARKIRAIRAKRGK